MTTETPAPRAAKKAPASKPAPVKAVAESNVFNPWQELRVAALRVAAEVLANSKSILGSGPSAGNVHKLAEYILDGGDPWPDQTAKAIAEAARLQAELADLQGAGPALTLAAATTKPEQHEQEGTPS